MRDGDGIDWLRVRATMRRAAKTAADNLSKFKEFAEVAAGATAKPTPLALAGLTVSALHALSGYLSGNASALFCSWGRVPLPPGCVPVVRAAFGEVLAYEENHWWAGSVDGQGVAVYAPQGWHEDAFAVAERDPVAALDAMRKRVRARAGAHSVLGGGKRESAVLTPTDTPTETPSAAADAVWHRIAPAIAAGHTRVVMLAGPPGTGKSTIARTLARRLVDVVPDAQSVRVPVSNFSDLPPSAIDDVLSLTRADVLLVDDLDRFDRTKQLLDLFEHCHGRQWLVVATVNDESKLPGALRRPGRIDEVVTVEGVGIDLARSILGPVAQRMTEEQVRATAGWPAAFVAELALRLRTIPGADPAAEVADMGGRARVNAA